MMRRLLLLLLLAFLEAPARAQYRVDTAKYEEVLASGEADLLSELEANSYVAGYFDPELGQIETEFYVYETPDSTHYSIGLIIDPCNGQSYDCCHRRFGAPTYAVSSWDSAGRYVAKTVFVSSEDPVSTATLVDEFNSTVESKNSRFADDEVYLDESCTASGAPYSSCAGKRQRLRRSSVLAACQDNNQTVDAASGCWSVTGTFQEHCVAVGWAQTAFVATCGGVSGTNGRCGTFLELHMAYSNAYYDVEDVLAEIQITELNATGYTTAILPLAWSNGTSAADDNTTDIAVACAYTHESFLINTSVLVKAAAPTCCCPAAYQQQGMAGGFMCPSFNGDNGPFAVLPVGTAALVEADAELESTPYCPAMDVGEDWQMVAEYSSAWNRSYSRKAETVYTTGSGGSLSWTSSDLTVGTIHYAAACPYFPGCATTNTTCNGSDETFTFAGRVGRIVSIPSGDETQYGVTFNDGRTVYYFDEDVLEVDADHNYEVWWVQRTMYNYIVRKRKAFLVASPACDFDEVNNQYFPYSIVDE